MGQTLLLAPGATRNLGIDWRNRLAVALPTAPTLASVAWDVPAGLDESGDSISGSVGIIQLSPAEDAADGSVYTVTGTATFSNGEVDPQHIYVRIAS